MNWRIWLTTCLLAAVTGVLAGAVVVGVSAQAVQPASADTGSDAGLLADTGLPVPGERPPTATAGPPAQVAAARTVPATQATQAAREKSKESDKADRSKRGKKGGDKSG